jgi:hypothetical protein
MKFHSAVDGFAGSCDRRIRADEPATSYSGARHAGSTHFGTGETYEAKTKAHKKMARGKHAKAKPAALKARVRLCPRRAEFCHEMFAHRNAEPNGLISSEILLKLS